MQGKGSRTMIVPLAVLGLSLTAMAWGHGFPGRGFHGLAGRPGGHSGMLLERLVFPCQADCFDAGRTCVEAAETAAETCAGASCATEITTAQAACQTDRTSSDCQTAVTALHTCAQSCIDTQTSAVSSCRSTVSTCLTTCGNS